MRYERHRPEQSVLHRVVWEHLDAFLREAREHGGLPVFIEKTFRAYLKCGIPEHGFIRLHCDGCGHDDLVAFSCKKRGVCPSCAARAAADGAAHLVDRVLPRVPWRQWVVSWPFEFGGKLAFQPDVLRACERAATDTIRTWMNARSGGNGGGVSVRHRFGSTLNLHVHLHLLVMEGGYSPDGSGGYVFNAAPAVTQDELEHLARTLREKVQRLFKRRGLLARDDVNNEGERLNALMMCGRAAQQPGVRERAGPALADVDELEVEQPRGALVTNVDGVNLYASPVIDGNDRERLEHLCRYLLRGPLALNRLKQRDDRMLTFRMKKPDRRGNTVLVLTPMQLLARLCSLVPAGGIPVRKYFGVLCGSAKERRAIVPSPTRKKCGHREKTAPAQSPVKWAELLKRVWGLDALACNKCNGRMRAMAIIEDAAEVKRFLAHLGKSTVFERARGPPQLAA